MARILHFLLVLYFCYGVSTRPLIQHLKEVLDKMKHKEKCPPLMAENISLIPHIKGDQDPTMNETFRLALKLFEKNISWDHNELRNVQALLRRLHSDSLRPASGAISTLSPVQNHFMQLEDLLKHENFSRCAWETVRKQMRNTLHRFHNVLSKRRMTVSNNGT